MLKKNTEKKVLYIITKSNFGGAQRYVYDLAKNITKDGYQTLVALGGDGILKDKLEKVGIKTISIPNLKRNINIFSEIKVFFTLLKILKRERPNIAHLNSSKIGGLGVLACRLMRIKKIIFTAHGFAHKEDRNIISKKIIKLLSWITIALSHKTIVVSNDDYKNAPKLFVKKKIFIIHNGISEINFEEKNIAKNKILEKISFIKDQNEIKKTIWIGTISELHKNKGLSFVIKAVNNLIKNGFNVSFFIIGEGEEKLNLEQLIKKEGLENNVFLLGFIENASNLLRAFDIFTLTSIKEGLPYVLLEAGLAILPVIASHIGGIPEIIGNEKSGLLIPPKNINYIEKAISDLINSPKNRIEYGNILKEEIKKDFTIEQMVSQTIKIYKK